MTPHLTALHAVWSWCMKRIVKKDLNDYSWDVQWREQSRVTVGKRSHVLGVSPLCWCPALETHCDTSSARPVQTLTLSRADSTIHCRLSFALILPQLFPKLPCLGWNKSLWFKGGFEWSDVCFKDTFSSEFCLITSICSLLALFARGSLKELVHSAWKHQNSWGKMWREQSSQFVKQLLDY